VDGLKPNDIVGWLHDPHQIVTTPLNHPEFAGVRVTPNVYTTLDEIDRFGDVMEEGMKNGLKA
jgi:selenocysteine lyase/cysteine desulfurase